MISGFFCVHKNLPTTNKGLYEDNMQYQIRASKYYFTFLLDCHHHRKSSTDVVSDKIMKRSSNRFNVKQKQNERKKREIESI